MARELDRGDIDKSGYVTGIYRDLVDGQIHLMFMRLDDGLYYIKVDLTTSGWGSTTMQLVAEGTIFHASVFTSYFDEVVSGFDGLRAYAVGSTMNGFSFETAIAAATSQG